MFARNVVFTYLVIQCNNSDHQAVDNSCFKSEQFVNVGSFNKLM
jgi:hypothetical protein